MKKILSFITCLLFFLLPLSACRPKEGLKTVRINEVTHSIFYAPLYLADSLGYFKDEGLKIELTNGGGADKVMAAVLSGDADIGFCGPEAVLYVAAGGSKDSPYVFGQLTKRDGSFLVSRQKETDFDWKNLQGKEILAGRKGGVPAMTFEYVLDRYGLKNGTNVTLNYDVAFNMMVSAFESGVADYCTMFEPTASEYEKAGKGYIVASVGEASGSIPYTCFTAKKSWIERNEDTVNAFLRAVTKAIRFITEKDAESTVSYLLPYFDSASPESVSTSVQSYKDIDAWVTNMAMESADLERLQTVMALAGELPKKVLFSDMVLTSYAQAAHESVYGGQ